MVVAVKFSCTHVEISDDASLPPIWFPKPPPPKPPPPMNQWIFPSATYCWNSASVGDGSEPLNPPIAITGSSVASW